MPEPVGEENIQEYLTAFADGELDAARILQVLDYLVEHPNGLQLMRSQQQLRLVAERVIRERTPAISDSVRDRISRLSLAAAAPQTGSGPRPRQLTGWRRPAVAAACLLAGFFAGRSAFAPRADTQRVAPSTESAIPVSVIAHASAIHGDCSRLADGLHNAGYPAEVGNLADVVRSEIGGAHPYPDLTPVGFIYLGAGPCAAPLENTIHLLYRSAGSGPRHTISVFVQRYSGQFKLNSHRLYLVSSPASPYPMYAWRTDAVVYYLLADDLDTAQKARAVIKTAPNPQQQ